jgi:hypothetical protein
METMKTKLVAGFMVAALVLLATRIVLRLAEPIVEDPPIHIPYFDVTQHPSDKELATWELDEARRVDWASTVETFDAEGKWKLEDKDHDARFREQMRQLGWAQSAEDCLTSRR